MKTHSGKAAQGGFTLVEIAIVLVIIGLLLGGILKGQEMITQAKIKNVVNDFNGMAAAVYSYQDRYRALAGDDLQAGTRWTGTAAGTGDGTWACTGGYKTAPPAVPAATEECNLFWQHLRLAGFVPGQTTGAPGGQQPNNAVNGIIGVQTTGLGFNSNIICSTNLPDKIAIAVDTQMDDGISNGGQVRAQLQAAPNPALGAVASAYQESGTNQYLICKNL
jgi:prepilin-type N-terminal cleavage/methylation domain-containing protein